MDTNKYITKVKEYGIKHNWPDVFIKRGDKIVRIISGGVNAWRNIVALAYLKEPYNAGFYDFVGALRDGNIWHAKE